MRFCVFVSVSVGIVGGCNADATTVACDAPPGEADAGTGFAFAVAMSEYHLEGLEAQLDDVEFAPVELGTLAAVLNFDSDEAARASAPFSLRVADDSGVVFEEAEYPTWCQIYMCFTDAGCWWGSVLLREELLMVIDHDQLYPTTLTCIGDSGTTALAL